MTNLGPQTLIRALKQPKISPPQPHFLKNASACLKSCYCGLNSYIKFSPYPHLICLSHPSKGKINHASWSLGTPMRAQKQPTILPLQLQFSLHGSLLLKTCCSSLHSYQYPLLLGKSISPSPKNLESHIWSP